MLQRHTSPADTGYFRGPDGAITWRVNYNPTVDPTITFRAATRQQILDAIREDTKWNSSATVDLAKHWLFEWDANFSLLHPNNIYKARHLVKDYVKWDINIHPKGYVLSRKFYDSLIKILSQNQTSSVIN